MSQTEATKVAQWLRSHPDFLVEHQDVLAVMQFPTENADTASIAAWQVNQLREENAALRGELDELVSVARENEALMDKVHALSVRLLAVRDGSEFLDQIFASLRDEFDADDAALVMFSDPLDIPGHDAVRYETSGAASLESFERILEKGEPFCGRLGAARLKFLFGDEHEKIESAALLPLEGLGMLGIGAHDPHRFHPDMGTAFLRVLADLLTVGLTRHLPQQQDQLADDRRRAG